MSGIIETTLGELIEALTEAVSDEPSGRAYQLEMVSLALENMVLRSNDASRCIKALQSVQS